MESTQTAATQPDQQSPVEPAFVPTPPPAEPAQSAPIPPQPTPAQEPAAATSTPQPSDQAYTQYINEQSGLIPGMTKPVKEEVLIEWQAPVRAFKKHNRQFYSTIGVIAALIALILFFAGQVIPVAVVFSVVFLIYVMNSIEPGIITNKLTNYGVRIEDELYYWDELGRFWIKEKYGQAVLYIEVSRFPNRLTILLGDLNKDDMQAVLSEVLLNEEPAPTTYEQAAKWLHQKIPIDLES